jgi:hypothetical protein
MRDLAAIPATGVTVSVRRGLSRDVADDSRSKIDALLRSTDGPAPSVRVRLAKRAGAVAPGAVLAQAIFHVNGRAVRTVGSGATAREAVDRLEAKLRRPLERVGQRRRARRWLSSPESAENWLVTCCESVSRAPIGLDEAALEMDLLGFDFHLFVEQGTRQEAVLYRAGPTGYRLALLDPGQRYRLGPSVVAVTVSPTPAVSLSTVEAVGQLATAELPFLFYLNSLRGEGARADGDQGRGSTVYRLRDGHCGLVSTSEDAAASAA